MDFGGILVDFGGMLVDFGGFLVEFLVDFRGFFFMDFGRVP